MPATMTDYSGLADRLESQFFGGQAPTKPATQNHLELADQLQDAFGLSQPPAQAPPSGQPAPVASTSPSVPASRPTPSMPRLGIGPGAFAVPSVPASQPPPPIDHADSAQKLLYRLPYMTEEAKQDPEFLKEWKKAHETAPAGDAKQLQASRDELWWRAADRAQAAKYRLALAKEAADETGPSMPRLGIGPGAFTLDRAQDDIRQRKLRNAEKEADEADKFERSVRTPAWARHYATGALLNADPKMLANKRYGEDFRNARKMLAQSEDPGDKAILKAMDLKDATIAKYRQGMSKHYKTAANLLEVHDDRGELKRRLRQVPANERPLMLDAMDELLSETDVPESARPGFGTRLSESYRAGVKQIEDTNRQYFGDETPEETETLRQIRGLVNREFSPSRESDPWLDRELQKTAQMVMPMAAMAGGGRLLGGAAKAAGAGKAVAGFATGAGVTGAAFPLEYTEMLDMAADQGIDPQVALQVAPWAALASSMVETILPDPWGPGSVSLKDGVYKAVTKTLIEHLVRAAVETGEEGIQGGIKGAGLVAASWLDENAPDMELGQAFQNAWDDLTESIFPMGILAGGPGLVRAPAAGVLAKRVGEQRAARKEFLESYHPARQSMREAHYDPGKGGFTKLSLPDAEAALDELENKPELTVHEERWRDHLRGLIDAEERSRSARREKVAKSRKKRVGDARRARIKELVEANRQRLQARQDFRQYMEGDEWEKEAEEWEAAQAAPEDPYQKEFDRLVAESGEALKRELAAIWDAKAEELGEEERKLYREFYTTPGTAYEWAEKNPEAAQKLADSPTYRIADFKAVDADLPEFDDPAARKQWKEWVKQSLGVPDSAREALRGPEMQDGKLTHEWQKVPEGVKPPQSLAVEVLETPGGTLARLRTAEEIANAKQKSTTARPDAGVPGPGAQGTAGEGGKTGTGPGDVPTVSSGGPGSGPVAGEGWDVVPDDARELFENEVLGNLRETVGRLDDAASKLGAVGQRAARDMAGNEPPGENIGKAGLDRFKEQAKQAGLDPDELLASHDEYQDLMDRLAKYQGEDRVRPKRIGSKKYTTDLDPQIDQMLLDGVPADKVAESLGIPASIVQRRESGLIPPAEQATEAPKKPTKSLAEMVVETRKRLGKKTGGTSDEGTGTDDTGGDGSGGTGTGGSDRPQISSVGVQGTKGTLNTADGAEREVQYFAVEDGYITPSHDARRNFARNEGGDENERPYHDQAQGETSRMVVWDIAKAKPGKLLHLTTDTPSPIDGPPMTTPEGIVLGGNARAMGIQLAYHNGGEAAARMKQAMVDAASKLGIDPAAVAKMERPVIIRVLTNPGDRGELSRILNESLAAGRTQAVSAASAGKKISIHTAEVISYYIEPDATGQAPSLRNVMADANKAVEIIKMLVRDGAMTKSEVERFVDPKTQRLNDEGKIYIEQALLGRVVPDPTLIGNMAAGVKKKVLAALGPLTRGVTDSKYGPRIAEVIQNAVAAFNGYKGSKSPIVRYFFGQQTFVPFPGQGDPSVAGVVLAMDEMGIRKFRAGWANVVDSLDIGSGAEQVKLFATVEKTDSADTAVQREFPLPSGWRKLGEKKEPTKEDKPDTQGKKKSLDDISEDDLVDDILGNTPSPTEPPQQKKKRADDKKSPRPKRDRKLGEMAKKATSEAVDAFNEFGNILGKRGISMNPMADPELQRAAAKLTVKLVKAGVLNFANFIDMAVQNLGRELVERIGPLLENSWTHIYNKFEPEGMTPAGNVAEILKEKKDGKEEETDESEEDDAGADDDVGGPGDAGNDRADGEGRLKTVRESTGRPPDTSVVDQSLVPHLRPHQVVGVASAIRAMDDQSDPDAKGGFLLADGTGAGKTRQILAVAQHYANRGFKVLLVAPSAVLGGPFSKRVPEISGSYADDAKAMGIEFNLIKKATRGTLSGVNITTYEYLKNVEAAVDKDVVLLFDEAHALKNYSASHPKHRAARGIRMIKAARSVLLATATPADKPSHLAYLVRTGMLEGKSYENQMRELGFTLVRRPSASFWTIDESVGAEEVYRRMDELFARVAEAGGMLKRELSMKGVNIDFETVELPSECYSLMQRIQDEFTDNGKKELKGKDKAIVRMHQRRQQEPFKIARAVEMAKEELAEGRRVIIYASRVNKSDVVKRTYARDPLTGERYLVEERLIHSSEGTLRTLKKKLEEAGITDISELHGGAESTSAEAQEKFQSGKARVLIATIESGGVGINLDDRAGDSPRTMIIMTAPFSAVENVQAAGRVWRMTSKSKPKIRFLFGDTGVDRWNRDIIASKMQTLDAVVSGDVGRLDVENAEWRQIQDVENLGLGGINELANQLMRGWSKEEVDNTVSLIKARAEKQGMSPDAWVAKQIAGVEIAESEAAARSYGGQQLYQRNLSQAQGMVEFLDDGRAVIRGFNGKNVSTLVHELGHIFRRDLTPEELKTAEQWAGVQGGRWTLGLEEKFARAFERWLREGKTTNPKLVSIFQKFKEWLTAIYSKLKNSPIQVRLGPEIRSLFDTMLGGTGEAVEVSGPDAGTSGPETGYSNVRQTKSQVPRKPGDDADGIAAQDIIKTWERIFKVPIRAGGFFAPRKGGQGKVGIYKFWPEIARIAEDYIGSLAVAMHEIAHHIDNTNKLFQPGSGAPLNVPQAEANEVAGLDYDKDKARTFEGFAEYLRMWITEPEINVGGQMKSPADIGAPMFHAWFQTKFLPTKPELAAQIKKAREHAQRYSDQSIFQRLKTLIAERLGKDLDWSEQWKADVTGKIAGMIIAKYDRFYGLTLADRLAKKRGWYGISVYDTAMFYALSEHANAAVAAAEGVFDIRRGPTEKIGTASLHGLARHLRSDAEATEANLYAFARHTLFMVQKNPHYRTAMDFEDAQGWVEHIKQDPDKHRRFEAFAKELARYNNDLLDMLVLAGHLDPEERDRMQKYYGDYYMPLHRVGHKQTGGGAGFVNLPHGFKARSKYGSDRPIVDPIEASLKKTIDAYKLAAGARVSIRLAEMLDPQLGGVKGAGGLMDRVDPKMVAHKGKIKEVLSTLVKEELIDADYARELRIAARILDGEAIPQRPLEWFANRHGIDLTAPDADTKLEKAAKSLPDIMTEIALWRQDFTPNADKAIVRICRNGEKIMYQLDRILHETATQNGMNRSYGAFMRAAIKMSRGFKMAVVGVSSAFAPANLVADFQEYQGKAKHVKGLGSITKPIARLIGYTAYHFGRQSEKSALYREYEAMAGKLYSQLGPDIGSRRRSAKRMLGKTVWSRMGLTFQDGSVFGHLKDAFAGGVDAYAETLAISDAPPRLAEAEAVIREHGFESRGTKWYNIYTGRPVSGLPEEVRIAAARAMGEATVNFKRFGTDREVMEAFLPFSNAAIQAMTRQGRQWANLQNLFKKTPGGQRTREAAEAQRLLVYYTALAAQTVLYWLWRRDDDDWKEQEPWLKDNYWTWGANGRTYFRARKPRQDAVFSNLIIALLESGSRDGRDFGDVLLQDVEGRLPTGGGLLRGAVEALVADYDYFRGRDLTPSHLEEEPTELQYMGDTDALSILLSDKLGKHIGLSPIKIRHLMDSASGGWYADVTKVLTGQGGWEDIPFVSGFGLNRHQATSINQFYERQKEIKRQRSREKAAGSISNETAMEHARLAQYADLMADIRALEPRQLGRRTYKYQPMLAGLARKALGKEQLVNNPDPFYADVPDEVRTILDKFVESRIDTAVLSHGLPEKTKEGDTDYAETLANWEAKRAAHTEWLREHKDSLVVKSALDRAKKKKSFRDLVTWRGFNTPPKRARDESLADYRARYAAFRSKRKQAMKWLGENFD